MSANLPGASGACTRTAPKHPEAKERLVAAIREAELFVAQNPEQSADGSVNIFRPWTVPR
jgi:ABC-type nitrate/sulfonate/bicarbonate transport system substrate-binding protein